jgi:hypothetical protein
MQGHLACLGSTECEPPRIELTTWGCIHCLFSSFLPSLDSDAARLLVSHFIQFLEYSGMTGFTGFRPEHFDYFVLHDNDGARHWVRDQMDSLGSQLRASLHAEESFYACHDVGNLRLTDAYCWVAFGPSHPGYRDVTHLSIALAATGLLVFVNAENKPATDRVKCVLRDSGPHLRRELVRQHSLAPFDLIVEKRTQRQASLYDYTPQLRLHSSMLADEGTHEIAWRAFHDTISQLPLPYLRIERSVPRQELLDFSSESLPRLIQHLSGLLLRSHELVRLLNGRSLPG